MEYYHTELPNGTIPPKFHMLYNHATDFVEKWKTGFDMLQDHYRHIHPESKVVKFKNKFSRKRKTTL